MIILGLDLSLSSTGWNIITDDNLILGCDKICTSSKDGTEYKRMQMVVNEIKDLIEVNSVDVVVAEDQFFAKNPKTGLTLSRLMGAVIFVCMELDVQIELLSPTSARKILIGDGKANKKQIADYIRENYYDCGEFSDKGKDKSSDKYDSLAISLAWNKKYKLDKKWNK